MSLPTPPNAHAVAVLLLTLVALALFTREKIPLQTSSVLILVTLATGFELFPFVGPDGHALHAKEFFYGFGHEALVAVSTLMIVGQALVRTGALEPVGRGLAQLWRGWPHLSMLLTLLIGATLSAFMNNTPIVVLMLPILIGVAMKTGVSPSGMLMPMGLATLVGGMSTTIGTSTNLLVVSVAADMGVEPFSMFDFALPAVLAGSVAILYLWLLAPRLLPERQPPMGDTAPRIFSADILLAENSPAVGLPLSQAVAKGGGKMQVKRIQRGSGLEIKPLPDVVLASGDRLLVSDTAHNLQEYKKALRATLFSGVEGGDETELFAAHDQQIAEVAIIAGSELDGQRVSDARLGEKYNLRLLAAHRGHAVTVAGSGELRQRILRAGDVLLVQASVANISALKSNGRDLLVLDGKIDLPRRHHAKRAMAIMLGVVVLAGTGVMPIALSATIGALLVVITGCLSWRDATRSLSSQVIFIVVASLALGSALMATGAADFVARVFLVLAWGLSAPWILAGLMLLMVIMTNVVSNNAAAVIGTPIAINIAQRLGLPIEPFVLAVLFGANLSYATPMAYKTNLLVMTAGGYTFGDFLRIGVPLSLLMWVVLSAVLIVAYQL